MGNTTGNTGNLIRSEVYSQMIKEELEPELFAQELMMMVTDFPDGDKLKIPVLTNLEAEKYVENTPAAIQPAEAGVFELEITEYNQSGISITDKLSQDAFYKGVLDAKFPAQISRALLKRLENDVFLLHKKQTNNDANLINGFPHRFVSTGNTNTTITLADIVKARTGLTKANVDRMGRMAIVDPTVAAQMLQLDGFTRQDVYGNNDNIKTGMGSTKWIGQYMGFDFYESNMLDEATALDYDTGGDKVANLFVGADAFIGAMRLPVDLRFWRQDEYLREVFHATTRYGLDLYRPESLVTVLTKSGTI